MTNLLADNAILILPDDDILIELEHLEVVHRRHHRHHHRHVTSFTITLPPTRQQEDEMDYPVTIPQGKDDIPVITANYSDGTSAPFSGTVTPDAGLEVSQTAEDGTDLPSGSYRLHVTDGTPGSYNAVFAEGGQEVVVQVTKEAAAPTLTGFSVTDSLVDSPNP